MIIYRVFSPTSISYPATPVMIAKKLNRGEKLKKIIDKFTSRKRFKNSRTSLKTSQHFYNLLERLYTLCVVKAPFYEDSPLGGEYEVST